MSRAQRGPGLAPDPFRVIFGNKIPQNNEQRGWSREEPGSGLVELSQEAFPRESLLFSGCTSPPVPSAEPSPGG